MAGNQLGKTLAGSMEVAMHLTGIYPEWFTGRRFEQPTTWWAGAVTGETTRDGPQRMLVGPPTQENLWGTGTIPYKNILDTNRASGITDYLDTVVVKHVSGGQSVLGFKTYESGRKKWQSETLDGVWFDEEPPSDIYIEGLTRTIATDGIVMVTFTPLLGMSEVVRMFLTDEDTKEMAV